jgi:hypothetical protein
LKSAALQGGSETAKPLAELHANGFAFVYRPCRSPHGIGRVSNREIIPNSRPDQKSIPLRAAAPKGTATHETNQNL